MKLLTGVARLMNEFGTDLWLGETMAVKPRVDSISTQDHRRFSYTSQLLLVAEREQPLLLRSFLGALVVTMIYIFFLQSWAGVLRCYNLFTVQRTGSITITSRTHFQMFG